MATEQAQVAVVVDKCLAVTAMKHLEGTGGKEVGVLGKEHDWIRHGNTKESRDMGKSTLSLVSPISASKDMDSPGASSQYPWFPSPLGLLRTDRDAGLRLFPHLPEPESLICHSLYQGALGLTGKRCDSPGVLN